jgi:predicted cupin superfamily sugar epimerase
MTTPDEIIKLLDLIPHPEGGVYRETFRDGEGSGSANERRAHSTLIYYLLRAGEESRWHRIDAAEIWHFYLGEALELFTAEKNGPAQRRVLGPHLERGEILHFAIPKGVWQSARPLGAFALVGCTVAPGFEFSGFEFAPAGWRPSR